MAVMVWSGLRIYWASDVYAVGPALEGEIGPRLEQLARLDEENLTSAKARPAAPH